jgi:hypothetical protein
MDEMMTGRKRKMKTRATRKMKSLKMMMKR